MSGRTVRIEIVGDNRSLKAALKDSEASLGRLEGSSKKAAASLGRIDAAFAKMGKATALVGAATAVGVAVRDVVDSASRLQQSQGAIDAVFQSNAESMREAAGAANDLGLSQAEYGEFASKLGSQLQNLGVSQGDAVAQTQQLIALGTDLAATYGGTVADAVDSLSALYRGETDPIEKYGVSIKQAEVNALAATDGISEAAARTKLLYEQTANAQGQWNREQDTFAVQSQKAAAALEDAKASIGTGLLPLFTNLAKVAGAAGTAFAALPDGLVTFATQIGAVIGGVKLFQVGLGRLQGRFAATVDNMVQKGNSIGGIAGAFAKDFDLAGKKFQNFARVAAGGLAVAGAAFAIFQQSSQNAQAAAEGLRSTLDAVSGAATEATRIKIGEEFAKNFDLSGLEETPFTLAEIVDAVAEGGAAFDDFKTRFNAWREDYLKGTNGLTQGPWVQALENSIDAANRDAEAARALADATTAAGDAAADSAGDVGVMTRSYEELAEAAESALSPMQEIAGITMGASEGYRDVAEAIDAAREASKGVGDVWDKNTRDFKVSSDAAREVGAKLDALAKAALDASGPIAMRDGVRAAVQNMRETRAAYIETATAAGVPKKEAERLADSLGLIPRDVRTQLIAAGFIEGKDKANDAYLAMKNLEGDYYSKLYVDTYYREFGGRSTSRDRGNPEQDVPGGEPFIGGLFLSRASAHDLQAVAQAEAHDALVARSSAFDRVQQALSAKNKTTRIRIEYQFYVYDEELQEVVDKFAAFEKQTQKVEDRLQSVRDRMRDTREALRELDKADGGKERKAALADLKRLGYDDADAAKAALKADAIRTQNLKAQIKARNELARNAERENAVTQAQVKIWRDVLAAVDAVADRINSVDAGSAWAAAKAAAETAKTTAKTAADAAKTTYDEALSKQKELTEKAEDWAEKAAQAYNPRARAYFEEQLRAAVKQKEAADAAAEAARVAAEAAKKAADAEQPVDLAKQIRDQAEASRVFAQRLRQLAAAGVSGSALQSVLDAGAEAGTAMADQLLANGGALAREYQATFNEIERIAQQTGLNILGALDPALVASYEATGKSIADATYGGLKKAIDDALAYLQKGFKKTWKKQNIPTGGGKGSRTINLTVTGNLVDPAGAAVAVRSALRDLERREGATIW